MDFEKIRNFLNEEDKFCKFCGIQLTVVGDGYAEAVLRVDENKLNGRNVVQGGAIMTLADFAFAVLSNYLHPMTVTQGGQISYLRAAKTKTVKAVATETARAGHNTVSEVLIYDDQDTVICICHFNGFVKDVPWDEFEKKITQ